MPSSSPKPCLVCRALVHDGSTRCAAHKVKPGSFADARRGTRHQRGYGAAWTRLREAVLRRDKGLCQPCLHAGQVTTATEVDHIKGKASGGTDDIGNLQAICTPCHRAKTAREAADGGGGENPTESKVRTDRSAKFFRAGVLEGGVSRADGGGGR